MIFAVLAKVGAHGGRGVGESIRISEIKYKSRATNPFPLYGLIGVGLPKSCMNRER